MNQRTYSRERLTNEFISVIENRSKWLLQKNSL